MSSPGYDVSVVIPTHNRAKLVCQAVRSCMEQPVAIEVLVVDDGSDEPIQATLRNEFGCRMDNDSSFPVTSRLIYIRQAHHTAIAPDYQQHKRIARWCQEHGVSCDNLKLVNARSQDVLPGLSTGSLDLVLIDGCHAFPSPFIDWYYTAEKLRKGGFLIVDDCHLITGKIMLDFLMAEQGRWEMHKRFGKTVVFLKVTSEPVVGGMEWTEQPYCQIHNAESVRRCLAWRVLNKARRVASSMRKGGAIT